MNNIVNKQLTVGTIQLSAHFLLITFSKFVECEEKLRSNFLANCKIVGVVFDELSYSYLVGELMEFLTTLK